MNISLAIFTFSIVCIIQNCSTPTDNVINLFGNTVYRDIQIVLWAKTYCDFIYKFHCMKAITFYCFCILFQDFMKVFFAGQYNEISSLKFALMKSLSSLSYGRKGQFCSQRKSGIDLPLSADNLEFFFGMKYSGEKSVKKSVAVENLENVFGKNWHIFNFTNSCTRKRIVGLVNLHYRRKTLSKPQKSNR